MSDLAGAPGVGEYVSEALDGHVDSRFTIDAAHIDDVMGRLHAARIHTLTVAPPSLDALFLRSYDGSEPEAPDEAPEGAPEEARR